MIIEVKVPSPGESITEVQLASWLVKDGETVERDAEIAEVDSDKATLTINAPESGRISIKVQEGDTVNIGTIIASIDTAANAGTNNTSIDTAINAGTNSTSNDTADNSQEKKTNDTSVSAETNEVKESAVTPTKQTNSILAKTTTPQVEKDTAKTDISAQHDSVTTLQSDSINAKTHITPLARKMMEEKNLSNEEVLQQVGRKRIGKADIESMNSPKDGGTSSSNKEMNGNQSPLNNSNSIDNASAVNKQGERTTERKKLSTLRLKLSQRLVSVKNETAMLTTFNEVNMSNIMLLRKKHNDKFKEKYGISVGFMSLFTKAVSIALQQFPQVNSIIDGEELIFHNYVDIGIAVSSPKGLVVPVLRNTESMSIAGIEIKIKELADKARNNKISLDEMTGGTFTISNGGVFGSLLSTPILNPPQSAILGMHNIVDRPIALNGQVVIAPMMYVALSYDHRVIDGRESVTFLVKVKELLEDPEIMFYQGQDPVKGLLGI